MLAHRFVCFVVGGYLYQWVCLFFGWGLSLLVGLSVLRLVDG